jgi:hypothetical protein
MLGRYHILVIQQRKIVGTSCEYPLWASVAFAPVSIDGETSKMSRKKINRTAVLVSGQDNQFTPRFGVWGNWIGRPMEWQRVEPAFCPTVQKRYRR